MKTLKWIAAIGVPIIILLSILVYPSQMTEVRGVSLQFETTAFASRYGLWLVAPDEQGEACRMYSVCGDQLVWSTPDLDNDGKEDLVFESRTHPKYFAKFIIQDSHPRVRLLEKNGIAVDAIPATAQKRGRLPH